MISEWGYQCGWDRYFRDNESEPEAVLCYGSAGYLAIPGSIYENLRFMGALAAWSREP